MVPDEVPERRKRLAMVISRVGENGGALLATIDALDGQGINTRMLFLDARMPTSSRVMRRTADRTRGAMEAS